MPSSCIVLSPSPTPGISQGQPSLYHSFILTYRCIPSNTSTQDHSKRALIPYSCSERPRNPRTTTCGQLILEFRLSRVTKTGQHSTQHELPGLSSTQGMPPSGRAGEQVGVREDRPMGDGFVWTCCSWPSVTVTCRCVVSILRLMPPPHTHTPRGSEKA